MASIKLAAQSSLPVAPDSYIYSVTATTPRTDLKFDTYQPISSSDKVAAISSDDSLLLLDPSTLKVLPNGHIRGANSSLTCVKPYAPVGEQANIILTAGRDGIVKAWDLRTCRTAFTLSAPSSSRNPSAGPDAISAIDCNAETNAIAAGTELEGDGPGDVRIYIWDHRNPQQPRIAYQESHTDTITELRYLPYPSTASTILMSGSTDGLVNVFNTTIEDEDDAVLQVSNHYSAIHHTGLIGDNIYALGTDEKLSFYVQQNPDLDQPDPEPYSLGDLRDQAPCDYAMRIWNGTRPFIALGSHNLDEQGLGFFPLSPEASSATSSPRWNLNTTSGFILPGGHGEEVIRDYFIAGEMKSVYTCGEDGSVKLWVQ
ncbi:hypothetical protein BT63DRAFT_460985 [Microthyrium microscopicum]|uniref:WD40 repeat-like protein n=1 Tax=Microthyrium microscopicum TaxID=703497 RepID=A0A6A6TWL5_9PEZI|nr:hypothetical protein BT63DRAFT_460985 [Microthyrium microscopicum]